MDLSSCDDDNPNLDDDYKAVLKRRRELAQTRKHQNWELASSFAILTASKNTGNATGIDLPQANTDDLLLEKLRDDLFAAVDGDLVDAVGSLLLDIRRQLLTLTASFMRQASGETALHRSLSKNLERVTSVLIDEGGYELVTATYSTEVDGNVSNNTCLHLVSEFGTLETARRLLAAVGSDAAKYNLLLKTALVQPEGQQVRNLTCLHIAAKAGKADMVRYYIVECGMDVNLKNSENDTPLLWAANDGHADVVELLIELGARVDEQNDNGSSPLHRAVRGHHLAVIESLLGKGKANVNIRRKLGLVCLLVMAAALAFDDVVKILIRYGADVNTRINMDETALHYAAGEGASEVCQTLIQAGAIVDPVDGDGATPLLKAAAHGHVNTVALLVRFGAKVQHMNVDRLSVWDYAINSDTDAMLDALLQLSEYWQDQLPVSAASTKSLKVKSLKFPKGVTPLHIAAKKGDASKIRLLLKSGIDVACRDSKGNTFMHIAAANNHAEILRLYCSETTASYFNNEGNTPLHVACQHGCDESIRVLAKKTKLQTPNGQGLTVLHEAARSRHIDPTSVSFLITQVVQSHDWSLLNAQDKSKNTALHLAVYAGNVQVVHALKPLSANVANSSGDTPLHVAATKRNECIVMQLLDDRKSLGKEIFNVLNDKGMSILNLAIQNKNIKLVEHIIGEGADLGLRCKDGNTALHLVVDLIEDDLESQSTYMRIVKLIVSKSYAWWAARQNLMWHNDSPEQREATKHACLRLLIEIINDDGLNVLQYAAAKGCAPLVQFILNMPHVFRHRSSDVSDTYEFDVTNMTPATVVYRRCKSKANVAVAKDRAGHTYDQLLSGGGDDGGMIMDVGVILNAAEFAGAVPPQKTKSLLELVVSNDNPRSAAEVLDAEPVFSVVKQYWRTYQWLFGIMMVLHVAHMAFLSYYGPKLMVESLTNCAGLVAQLNSSTLVTCQPAIRRTPVLAECVILVVPAALVLFEAFNLMLEAKAQLSSSVKTRKRRVHSVEKVDITGPLGVVLLRMCGIGHALFTIAWYVAYRFNLLDQDYMLAVALALGWVFSINYTRGFKIIHHFNLMLRYMIFRDFLKFLVFFAFLLLGFSFAQYTMIRSDPINNVLGPIDTLFVSFDWMIGAGNFWNAPDMGALLNRYVFEAILFMVYCVGSSIVLVNLLIAMMSDSYSEVRDSSALFWRVNSIEMAINIEKFAPTVTRAIRKLRRGPSTLRYDRDKHKWFCTVDSRQLNASLAASGAAAPAGEDFKISVTALDEKVSTVQKDIYSLRLALEQLSMQVQVNRPKLVKELDNAFASGSSKKDVTTDVGLGSGVSSVTNRN